MKTFLDCFYSLLCMYGSDTRNDNRLQIGLFKHFVVVFKDLNFFKVLRSPFTLLGIRSARSYDICTSSELVEVDRMAFACLQSDHNTNPTRMRMRTHTAKACDTDAKLLCRHCH
jgi:hypothetical protein